MENNYFISQKNKYLLWQLLIDNNSFSHLYEEQFENVKSKFEEIILSNDNETLELKQKNKKVLQEVIKYINTFNDSKYKKEKMSTHEHSTLNEIYVEKPQKKLQAKLQNDYNNKKEEFFELIKKPNPDEIDFNDKTTDDTPIDSKDMDKILNNIMEERDLELSKITESFPKLNTLEGNRESNGETNGESNAESIEDDNENGESKLVKSIKSINNNSYDISKLTISEKLDILIFNQNKILNFLKI